VLFRSAADSTYIAKSPTGLVGTSRTQPTRRAKASKTTRKAVTAVPRTDRQLLLATHCSLVFCRLPRRECTPFLCLALIPFAPFTVETETLIAHAATALLPETHQSVRRSHLLFPLRPVVAVSSLWMRGSVCDSWISSAFQIDCAARPRNVSVPHRRKEKPACTAHHSFYSSP
jgi:hypothetical protein